jgi:hypothetical protein
MRRLSRTLETMAGGLDRLLGFIVADPEMPGDAMHHDPLRRIGAGLPFGSQFLDSLAEPIGHAKQRGFFGIGSSRLLKKSVAMRREA